MPMATRPCPNSRETGKCLLSKKNKQSEDMIIFGAGGLAREIAFVLRELAIAGQPYNMLGFVVDDGRQLGQMVAGYPVADLADVVDKFSGCNAAIAIGDPKAVHKFATNKLLADANLTFPNLIHPSVIWDVDGVDLGRGNILCAGNILTTDIRIGSFNVINPACTIGHDAEIGNYCALYPAVNISGNVKLHDGVLIGVGAKILQSIEVGAGAVIGAGAVVTKDVPAGEVVVGIPAKPLRQNQEVKPL